MLDQFRLVADERFVEFRPSGDDLKLASDRSEEMGILPNSYTRGAGRMLGLLGEITVEKYLDGLASNCSSRHYGYDLITESGITIEVKTKRSRGIPKLDYTASVEKRKRTCLKTICSCFFAARTRMQSCGCSAGSRRTRLSVVRSSEKRRIR